MHSWEHATAKVDEAPSLRATQAQPGPALQAFAEGHHPHGHTTLLTAQRLAGNQATAQRIKEHRVVQRCGASSGPGCPCHAGEDGASA